MVRATADSVRRSIRSVERSDRADAETPRASDNRAPRRAGQTCRGSQALLSYHLWGDQSRASRPHLFGVLKVQVQLRTAVRPIVGDERKFSQFFSPLHQRKAVESPRW